MREVPVRIRPGDRPGEALIRRAEGTNDPPGPFTAAQDAILARAQAAARGDFAAYEQATAALERADAEAAARSAQAATDVLRMSVEELRHKDPQLTEAQAWVKAAEQRPDLLGMIFPR